MKTSRIITVFVIAAVLLAVLPSVVSAGAKVTICHVDGQGRGHTIEVDESAVPSHIGPRGHARDYYGACSQPEPTQVPPPTATPVQPTNPPPTSTDVPVQPTSTPVPVSSPTPPPTPTFPAIIGTPPVRLTPTREPANQPDPTSTPVKRVTTRVPKTWPTVTPVDTTLYCEPVVVTKVVTVYVYGKSAVFAPTSGGGAGGIRGRR